MKPIFETTGQAIYVAFQIHGSEQQDSTMRKALIRVMESINLQSDEQSEWLAQLRGTRADSTVDFEGLSSNDIRAQCALIMSAIHALLPQAEIWALQAKYSRTDYEGPIESRRYAFSKEKAAAIRNVARWLAERRALECVPRLALDCMVAKFYANHKKTEISFRQLAIEFGGNHMSYARAFPKVKALLKPLEAMAIARLQPHFEEQGIVACQSTN
ncbi:hypothetical protein [Noviherbaspirillum cavernae]|nr:hypothetical protein [Noviherbaspirillum cavernae]